MVRVRAACGRMEAFKDRFYDGHNPNAYFDMVRDPDVQGQALETVPRFRVGLQECIASRRTVKIEGLNFDTQEVQFLERFGQFRRRLLPWGGITGLWRVSSST